MHVEITSSGSPVVVKTDLANQVKRAGKDLPAEAWPALVNLRDYAASLVNKAPSGADVALSIKVEVSTSYVAPTAEATAGGKKK